MMATKLNASQRSSLIGTQSDIWCISIMAHDEISLPGINSAPMARLIIFKHARKLSNWGLLYINSLLKDQSIYLIIFYYLESFVD